MATSGYEYALKLLTARPYAARSLHRKLTQKGFSPEEISQVMQRLERSGLVNDTKFAEQYARSKVLTSGTSKRRLMQDLRRKGISEADAKGAIESVYEQEAVDPLVAAEKAARKKLAQLGELEPLVLRRRLFGFLARRGHELEDIKRVVARLTR